MIVYSSDSCFFFSSSSAHTMLNSVSVYMTWHDFSVLSMSLTLSLKKKKKNRSFCFSVQSAYLSFSNIHYLVNWIGCWETIKKHAQEIEKRIWNCTRKIQQHQSHCASLFCVYSFFYIFCWCCCCLIVLIKIHCKENEISIQFCNEYKSTHIHTQRRTHSYPLTKRY